MKKVLFLACILLCAGCTDVALEADQTAGGAVVTRSTGSSTFEFPDIPWASFDTHAQKVAACQVPDTLLPHIPTAELVEICMKYPLLMDAYAFNTPLEGLKSVVAQFNGLTELMKRPDNSACLLAYLQERDIRQVNFSTLSLVEEGRTTLLYALAEYLLALPDVMKNATGGEDKEIAAFAREVLNSKEADAQHHSMLGLTSSLYLWAAGATANSSVQTRSTDGLMDRFLQTGEIHSMEEYAALKSMCNAY